MWDSFPQLDVHRKANLSSDAAGGGRHERREAPDLGRPCSLTRRPRASSPSASWRKSWASSGTTCSDGSTSPAWRWWTFSLPGARAYRHLADARKDLGIKGRCGVFAPDDEAVEAAYQEWLDVIESENARNNAAAETEYQRLLQESQDRKDAQERDRLAYREWSPRGAVEGRGGTTGPPWRLLASRIGSGWTSTPPRPTCGSEARRRGSLGNSTRARRPRRRGRRSLCPAAASRITSMRAPTGVIGRKWAQGVAERYEAALARAEEVLEGVAAGRQPYPVGRREPAPPGGRRLDLVAGRAGGWHRRGRERHPAPHRLRDL